MGAAPLSNSAVVERRWPAGTLRVTDVARSFEGVQALQGVSIHVDRHEVVGLIGPNGAGKTTLINLITGFDLPSSGTIELGDDVVTRWNANRRAHAGLARTFQHGHLFRDLSVSENVELASLGVGMKAREARVLRGELLDALGLSGRADVPASSLSHGEEQKVGIARALASRPRYVLMDEPAAGLSEADIEAFKELITQMRDQHEVGLLIIDHNVALIMDVCDRIYVLDRGTMLAEGTPEEIRRNLDVSAAYLGSSRLVSGGDDA